MPLTVVLAELPATSTAVPMTDWFAPSCRVTGAVQPAIAMPEPVSVHVNDTVTSVLLQPAPFGAGDWEPTMPGAIVSILTTTAVAAELPARSVTEPVTVETPSADTT